MSRSSRSKCSSRTPGFSRARVSQVAVEVARSAADHITFVRASQLTLEVLLPYRVARFTVQIV